VTLGALKREVIRSSGKIQLHEQLDALLLVGIDGHVVVICSAMRCARVRILHQGAHRGIDIGSAIPRVPCHGPSLSELQRVSQGALFGAVPGSEHRVSAGNVLENHR